MTPVKPQISKFKVEKSCQVWALTCYGGSTHERVKRVKSFVHVGVSFCICWPTVGYCAYLSVSCLE
jgi:hypothetical protein